jgi:hypothetical protein
MFLLEIQQNSEQILNGIAKDVSGMLSTMTIPGLSILNYNGNTLSGTRSKIWSLNFCLYNLWVLPHIITISLPSAMIFVITYRTMHIPFSHIFATSHKPLTSLITTKFSLQ